MTISMYTDTEHFVGEVIDGKNGNIYWSASNQKLSERVYERVKEMIPKAKYYEFEGLQFITVNDKQEDTLLKFLENLSDMYELKISEINAVRDQILEGSA